MAEDEGFDKVELEDKDKDKRAKDGKEEKEEVGKIVFESETFSSMAWRKCKHFFTNITLEPVMLFYGIVGLVQDFFFELSSDTFLSGASIELLQASSFSTRPASTTLASPRTSATTSRTTRLTTQLYRCLFHHCIERQF